MVKMDCLTERGFFVEVDFDPPDGVVPDIVEGEGIEGPDGVLRVVRMAVVVEVGIDYFMGSDFFEGCLAG